MSDFLGQVVIAVIGLILLGVLIIAFAKKVSFKAVFLFAVLYGGCITGVIIDSMQSEVKQEPVDVIVSIMSPMMYYDSLVFDEPVLSYAMLGIWYFVFWMYWAGLISTMSKDLKILKSRMNVAAISFVATTIHVPLIMGRGMPSMVEYTMDMAGIWMVIPIAAVAGVLLLALYYKLINREGKSVVIKDGVTPTKDELEWCLGVLAGEKDYD